MDGPAVLGGELGVLCEFSRAMTGAHRVLERWSRCLWPQRADADIGPKEVPLVLSTIQRGEAMSRKTGYAESRLSRGMGWDGIRMLSG